MLLAVFPTDSDSPAAAVISDDKNKSNRNCGENLLQNFLSLHAVAGFIESGWTHRKKGSQVSRLQPGCH